MLVNEAIHLIMFIANATYIHKVQLKEYEYNSSIKENTPQVFYYISILRLINQELGLVYC